VPLTPSHTFDHQGDTSSQSEPRRYLQAVQALVAKYLSLTYDDATAAAAAAATTGPAAAAAAADGDGGAQDADMLKQPLQQLPPLVINTPGWITGLGLDLLAEVLRCAQPTHGRHAGAASTAAAVQLQ